MLVAGVVLMEIPVIVEMAFQNSYWCRQTVSGMLCEARRKKYPLQLVECGDGLKENIFQASGARLAVIIGTSRTFVPGIIRQIEEMGGQAILVNCDFLAQPTGHSVVRMDYTDAMQSVMRYFYGHGRRRIALFGFNPDSSADMIKEQFFISALAAQGCEQPRSHIYRNNGSIGDCFSDFLPCARGYDAMLCANDLVAIAALRRLREAGIAVPGDILLAGFGESVLAEKVAPSLTTITLNHEEMGRQAVMLYSYLSRQDSDRITAVIQVKSRLTVRESTAGLPVCDGDVFSREISTAGPVDFYQDPEIRELMNLEEFCLHLDALDQEILLGLVDNRTPEEIAEKCYTSVSTVGYRLRNMQARCGAAGRQELIQKVFGVLNVSAFRGMESGRQM